jgi:outer membrane protein assembly factor BamB
VISIALDGRMFAINKATGEVVWERKIADPVNAEVPIAPLVIRDMAIVGTAGGEFGIRGFIEATRCHVRCMQVVEQGNRIWNSLAALGQILQF